MHNVEKWLFAYRNRILQYPALVNCTTIDWFCEWPKDALLEVAERYLDGMELGSMEGVRHAHTKRDTCTFTFEHLSTEGRGYYMICLKVTFLHFCVTF